jgi:hypothetical protein
VCTVHIQNDSRNTNGQFSKPRRNDNVQRSEHG